MTEQDKLTDTAATLDNTSDNTSGNTSDAEIQEWLEAFEDVCNFSGRERGRELLHAVARKAGLDGVELPFSINTPYVNTIPRDQEPEYPGDLKLEKNIRSYIRWNAMMMVMRANMDDSSIGGHISTFSSIATLYEVGFNHFFKGPEISNGGDMIFFQGHSSPGIYSRSFLEGRITEEHMNNFRHEAGKPKLLKDKKSLSSYPHPWLMPDYWQFPTVSMGLGPMQAIHQAHIMKYLDRRELIPMDERKVWCFMGDGESDEPESLGGLSLAGRENLDNLIFVVNCNLQRLDGPVRGNGKIIQELEGVFRGAGWNVLKVIWGRRWDPLFEKDTSGLLAKNMEEVVDGEYQNFKNKGGEYTRKNFFGRYPELAKMVEDMSDEDIYSLNRGGHDLYKVYAAYDRAVKHKGQPTVILAKSVKGYATPGEAENIAHSLKKIDMEGLKKFRDRFNIPLTDKKLEKMEYYAPPANSPEIKYMKEKRKKLGGFIPQRNHKTEKLNIPELDIFKGQLESSGEREYSSTMSFVRMLSSLCRDKNIGKRVVPIVPDEARTFGMEGLFRQLGIYSSAGQKYVPQDADQIMSYREDVKGQILEEGINEAGSISAWIAAATSAYNNSLSLIPFYIFYSMFGFQRVGDFIWAAGDMQAQGFLIGATSGRTTLAGEGLQHLDGHSHIMAGTVPNCISYDPTFSYELAVIVHSGMKRMYVEGERVFYYITTMNESYQHPAMPEKVEDSIIKGLYLFKELAAKGPANKSNGKAVRLLSSGSIMLETIKAAEILNEKFGLAVQIWSATSCNELTREATALQRENLLNPTEKKKASHLEKCLNGDGKDSWHSVPMVAATDYIRQYTEQLRPFISSPYYCLGTDGFGRSDSREAMRDFYEVDAKHIAYYSLSALFNSGNFSAADLKKAAKSLKIDTKRPFSLYQ